MHMADALISPVVGGVGYAAFFGSVAYSVKKVSSDKNIEEKVPLMAISAAFIFAAQMINFTIPATGSSGHITGGLLLASLLGGPASVISLSAVLIIQCLFFADGGLLALGLNIINMGVVPALIVFPLIMKNGMLRVLTNKNRANNKVVLTKIVFLSVISCIVALQLGSFLVVVETTLSGISELKFEHFLLFMQPIHLAIGFIEGLITASIIVFIYQAKREIIFSAIDLEVSETADILSKSKVFKKGLSLKVILISFGIVVVGLAAFFYAFASTLPDGLEWSIEKIMSGKTLDASGNIYSAFSSVQKKLSFMPDYTLEHGKDGWSPAGLIGAALVLILVLITSVIIKIFKKSKKSKNNKTS